MKSLWIISVLFTPMLNAQDAPGKVREIEQKVLQEQYQKAVQSLAGAAREPDAGNDPEIIGKRLQWVTLVSDQLEADDQTTAANQKNLMEYVEPLNDLAWRMVTSSDPAARHPETALKLATLAIELAGVNGVSRPNVLDTKARSLFLLGKREEAIAEQEKAVAAATVAEEKAGFEATLAAYRRGELPEVLPAGGAAESGALYIVEKLNRLIIPQIDFEDTTLKEAIEFLRLRSVELDVKELDPAKKGVNFVIRRPRPADAGNDLAALRVRELRLRNVPLGTALKYLCDQTNLRFKVDDFAVTFVSRADRAEDIFVRSFEVPSDFSSILDSGGPIAGRPITEVLKSAGINFGEGSSATLTSFGTLMVTNTPIELDKIEQLVSKATVRSERARKPARTPVDPSKPDQR